MLLRMHEVTKRYTRRGHEVVVLRKADLDVPQGQFVSVVGPSGSGKSTLLLMLGGMLSPSEGEVFWDGVSVFRLGPDERAPLRRRHIGFVFQTFNLVPYLSALENVQVPLYLAGLSREEQQERAAALLEQVGLGDRLDHRPRELSVGQQQRVALARTLANDPAVILADEPTGNLDPETGRQVLDDLSTFHRQGRTIVMVTHDPAAARRAERVLRLCDGCITEEHTRQSLSVA